VAKVIVSSFIVVVSSREVVMNMSATNNNGTIDFLKTRGILDRVSGIDPGL